MPLTFGLQDASDMLAKLHHEHERLEREVTSYNLFNFVVTAYHLIEWVKRRSGCARRAKRDLDSIRKDTYIAVCRGPRQREQALQAEPGLQGPGHI